MPNLKVVANHGVGYNHIDVKGKTNGIILHCSCIYFDYYKTLEINICPINRTCVHQIFCKKSDKLKWNISKGIFAIIFYT